MDSIVSRCFLTLLLSSFVHSSRLALTVDCEIGVDSPNCIKGLLPCKTLDYLFSYGNLNNSIIHLNGELHSLKGNYTFHNLNDITLQSINISTVECVSKNNGGLHFAFGKHISIYNLTFFGCGMTLDTAVIYPNESMDSSILQVAISFVYCEDIEIRDTTFNNSLGIGLALFDVAGNIIIENSKFSYNTDQEIFDEYSNQTHISGGGIHMQFRKSWQTHRQNKYNILNNLFCQNFAAIPDKDVSEDVVLNKGAGLSMFFLQNSMNNIIVLENCTFTNNTAVWGGAAFILFKHQSQNNSLTFQNCIFKRNNAINGGGGIRLHLAFKKLNKTVLANDLMFNNIEFEENNAIWGGGISISGKTRAVYAENSESRNIYFTKCIFVHNSATVGFGMGLATDNLNKDILGTSPSYRVVITNSKFFENFMKLTEDDKVIGQGVIYAEELAVALNGNNIFAGNTFTSLVLDSSSLIFEKHSFSEFQNNTGLEGGALAMYGLSWMMLKEKSTVLFQNNRARRKGGAIYYKSGGPPRVAFQTTQLQTLKCFIQYEDRDRDPNTWPVKLTFTNNTAPDASGNSVYASTLQFCRQPNEDRISDALNWKFTKYNTIGNNQPEIVTNAIDIKVNTSEWKVQPNIPFSPHIVLYDEKNQSVYGSFKVQIQSNDFVSLAPPNNIFLLKDNISKLRIVGKPKTNFSFRFITTSGQMIQTQRYHAEIKECPLGFKLDKNSKCVCMGRVDNGVVRCDANDTVYILKDQWGYRHVTTNLLATTICPVRYCDCLHEDPTEPYLCELIENRQCAKSRTGILCSKCEKGLSVNFGNELCTECSNINLLLFIPFTVVLFIFVLLIFYFNVDLFSGYLNAFIYSYQMVLMLIPENVQLDWFIEKIIYIASLRGTGGSFGVCLFNGMDNLQKLAINYILPVLMIILTVILGTLIPQRVWNKMFCRNRVPNELEQNLQKKSFGRALSFVLVFCYASFTEVTLKLLGFVHVNNKKVVYHAAFVGYFEDEHIFYGILAIFVLVFIVILFPVVLLFTSFFISRFTVIRRNRPVFDALKTCYKPEKRLCQSFVAFYFICRLLLQLISVTIQNEISRLIVLSITCVLTQVIFSAVQPYQIASYNLWDILLLTNMCIISLLSLILSVPYTTSEAARQRSVYALRALVYIPLITVILRLISYSYKKYYQTSDIVDGRGNIQRKRGIFSDIVHRFRGSFRRDFAVPVPQRVQMHNDDDDENGNEEM